MPGKAFSTVLDEIEPPRGLCAAILSRIALARRRQARLRLALQSVVCFASGLVLVPIAQYVGQELYASGFYDYMSLLFGADRASVFNSWSEFLYSLVESLPSAALLVLLGACGILFWSLHRALRNGRIAFMPLRHSI